MLGKHRLGHKPACLVTGVEAPTQGPCPHPSQGLGHRSPASLAGDRSPCLSLSGCVLYETTFLLGLTRDPPHPPMGGDWLSHPSLAKKANSQSFTSESPDKGLAAPLPAPGAQPGSQGSQRPDCMPHIPWLVYLFG